MGGEGEERAPGTIIAGRYRVESTLGAGGMAIVYRATDLAERRTVALKILRANLMTSGEAVERFLREGELLRSRLVHPTIVAAETYGALDDGCHFLVMELLDGETLGAKLRRGGRLSPLDLAPILTGVCAGVQAAHAAGVLHRDLKPDNIFLVRTASPSDIRVKLLDFGISKITGAEKLTQTGEVVGTPRYMAPEQLLGEELDLRVDVYALGVIAYEALAGHPPFVAPTPSDLIIAILRGEPLPLKIARPDLPTGLDAVVMRSLAKSRTARYDSVVEFANAFVMAVAPGFSNPGPVPPEKETRALGSMTSTQIGRAPKKSRPPLEPGTFGDYAGAPQSAPAPVSPPAERVQAVSPNPSPTTNRAPSPNAKPAQVLVASPKAAVAARDIPKTREAFAHATRAASPIANVAPASPAAAPATTEEMAAVMAGLGVSTGPGKWLWVAVTLAALAGGGLAAWLATMFF